MEISYSTNIIEGIFRPNQLFLFGSNCLILFSKFGVNVKLVDLEKLNLAMQH